MRQTVKTIFELHTCQTRRLASFTVIALLGAVAIGGGVALLQPKAEGVLLTAIMITLIAPLLLRVVQHRFDPFEPLVLLGAIYGALFLARPIAVLVEQDFSYRGQNMEAQFTLLLASALIGIMAFNLGYLGPWSRLLGRRIPALPYRLSGARMLAYALMLIGASISLFLIFVQQSGGLSILPGLGRGISAANARFFSASTQYLSQGIFLLIPASLLLFGSSSSRNRLLLNVLGLGTMLLAGLFAFPLGARRWLLTGFGSLYALYYLKNMTRPRTLTIFLVGVAIFFGGVTFVRDARDAAYRESRGLGNILIETVADPAATVRAAVQRDDTEPPIAFALLTQVVPDQLGYYFGWAAIRDLIVSPIPRVLWPEKPITAIDEVRVVLFGQPCDAGPGGICPTFTLLADFYIEGGLAGVALGMFVVGVILGTLYSYYLANQQCTGVQIFYAAALPYVVLYIRANLVPVTTWMSIVLVPVLIGVLFAANRRSGTGVEVAVIPGKVGMGGGS